MHCVWGRWASSFCTWNLEGYSNTIRHVALSLVNPSTLEVLGKPYRKEMYGRHPPGMNFDRGIAPLRASRYFPIFVRAAPRPTQCRKIKTPQVCKQSGTLSVRLPPHLSASFLPSWSSGGVQIQIVFGSFPLPLVHKLLPNLTQRRLQVLACIYCIRLRNFCWNSNMMPQNLLKQLHWFIFAAVSKNLFILESFDNVSRLALQCFDNVFNLCKVRNFKVRP